MSFRRSLVAWLMRKEVGVTEKEWRRMSYSFSQDAEDLILDRILHLPGPGFYVDVGAYHPVNISNTWHFYQLRGWRGICIEPNPDMVTLLKQRRPRDIVIQAAIGNQCGMVDYEMFDEPNYNRIANPRSVPEYLQRLLSGKKTVQIPIKTLAEVLRQHVPALTHIDLLSIDCEEHDFQVLQSNDWNRYRPTAICVESHTASEQKEIGEYLRALKYESVAKVNFSLIFLSHMD
jgi:FkbM family methyltransferase